MTQNPGPRPTSERMVEARDLTFAYPGGAEIFALFSWQIERGETWAVIGPSGCGKTTLLYLLAGLIWPSSGELRIGGECLRRPRPDTGLILQDYGLLPWATLRANAALGLRVRTFYGPDGLHSPSGEQVGDIWPRVDFWLKRLGLEEIASHYPSQVSGGQRQRAAIARTLVLRPDLLLMDEPFSSLDAPTRESLQSLMLDLQAEQGLTSIVVTHNIEEAAFMGRRILFLGRPPQRQGVVLANPGAGPLYRDRRHPAYREMCDRLRKMLDATIQGSG
ncbi:MAG: ATP-binding cassette domain-containing protein [Anaerolineales bacterium]|jgi:NitT/TauT family transport system ATP-binding protein